MKKLIQPSFLRNMNKRIFTEEALRKLAVKIDRRVWKVKSEIVFNLINDIPKYNYDYDWNVGSILQHLEPELIISALDKVNNINGLYNSVGLAWVLGEFKNQHPIAVDFLYSTVIKTKNPEAWWRAAFSLERISFCNGLFIWSRRGTKCYFAK